MGYVSFQGSNLNKWSHKAAKFLAQFAWFQRSVWVGRLLLSSWSSSSEFSQPSQQYELIIHQLRDCHPYELMIISTTTVLLNTSAYNILLQHCISFFFLLPIPSTLPYKEQELLGFFESIVFSGLKDTGIASCIIWQGYSQKGPVADITWRIRFNRRLGSKKRVPSADYKEGCFFFEKQH